MYGAKTDEVVAPAERDELLRRAAALCHGSFLAGETEPWAAPMRERIRNRFQGLAALRSH
jgi:hypothetical protein